MLDSPARKQILIGIVSVAALALAAHQILSYRSGNRLRQASHMHKSGGHAIARLAAKTFPDKSHVLLIVPDHDMLDTLHAGWMKEMEDACEAGLSIEGRETLATMLSRLQMTSNRPTAFTLAVYRDFLKRHPAATAVISLIGEPLLSPGETVSKAEKFPPMVCFAPSAKYVPEWMAQGIVAAAYVPLSHPSPPSALKDDWFDIMYEIVTPDTVGAWAAAVSKGRAR